MSLQNKIKATLPMTYLGKTKHKITALFNARAEDNVIGSELVQRLRVKTYKAEPIMVRGFQGIVNKSKVDVKTNLN